MYITGKTGHQQRSGTGTHGKRNVVIKKMTTLKKLPIITSGAERYNQFLVIRNVKKRSRTGNRQVS